MTLAAALIYGIIIAMWLAVFAALGFAYIRNPRTFGTVRLLLSVLLVDAFRNIAEGLYFGIYFGGKYGLFPHSVVDVLGNPNYLFSKPLPANLFETFVSSYREIGPEKWTADMAI